MKRLISLLLCFVMLFSLAACKGDEAGSTPTGYITDAEKQEIVDSLGKVYVEISIKEYGKLRLELYPDIAPVTVKNFIGLADAGFYNGLIFHRVIEDFMIQGGDPDGNGTGGSDETIYGEFSSNGVANSLKHTRGVISMARSQENNSASSQFFICHKDASHLDGSYAAFGRVTAGMAVVDAVAQATTNSSDKPLKDVVIEYVKRVDSPEIASVKAEMKIEGYEGVISLELYPDLAPQTVNAFTSLAKSGYYDGLTFRKIMKDTYLQGGKGDTDKVVFGEFSANGVENTLTHERGVISMARGKDVNSGKDQFFICLAEMKSSDGSRAAFGRVTAGLEILDKVSAVEVDEENNPIEEVKIEYIKIVD